MTGIDTNILIDLLVASSSHHETATKGISALDDELCTTTTNIAECLRLLTHPKAFEKPLKPAGAVEAVSNLIEHYGIVVLEEDSDWWRELPAVEKIVPGLRGNEIFDARIAIGLRQNGVRRIYTRDADFRKYPFLKTVM